VFYVCVLCVCIICIYTYMCVCVCAHKHTYKHTHSHTHTHTLKPYTDTLAYIHTDTYLPACDISFSRINAHAVSIYLGSRYVSTFKINCVYVYTVNTRIHTCMHVYVLVCVNWLKVCIRF
jgi:hypothetical protein